MRILTVNAGSSSLKLAVVEGGVALASESADGKPSTLDATWLGDALTRLPTPDAVAHRIVHGGRGFSGPTLIDGDVLVAISDLTALAPLHQPEALAAIDLVATRLGHLPAVACFDTAFFADLPPEAATYAIPEHWRESHGVRRYGFHGLSHAWIARRVAELVGTSGAAGAATPGAAGAATPGAAGAALRLVSCHLGSGASLAAIAGGRPLDTTMGFTPAEGLVMATRPGILDPAAAPYLLRQGVSLDELDESIERRSGIVALAGTPDLKTVLAAAARGEPRAVLARDVYLHRLGALIAAMAAALGGIDVVAFAGGVGEHSAEVRAGAARRCAFLGLELDEDANGAIGADGGTVSSAASRVRLEVVPAREDLEMARQAEGLLDS